MTPRNRRPSSATETSGTKTCGIGRECRCCQATQRARELTVFDPLPEWSSPLTPGMQAVNLSVSEDGRGLFAALSRDWARMFQQLTLCGPGLLMTRNEGAILGRRMEFPSLTITATGGEKGANGTEGLWLDFRRLNAARALHMRSKTGHVFGVEFSDFAGRIIHRFTLTPESDLDEFLGWVRLHQACEASQPPCWLDEDEMPHCSEPACSLRECSGHALMPLLTACVEHDVPLQVTVRSAAVTHRANLTPRSLASTEDWWFLSDDVSGLHFQPALLNRVTVEKSSGGEERGGVTVCAALENNVTALVLRSGNAAAEGVWQCLVDAIL